MGIYGKKKVVALQGGTTATHSAPCQLAKEALLQRRFKYYLMSVLISCAEQERCNEQSRRSSRGEIGAFIYDHGSGRRRYADV